MVLLLAAAAGSAAARSRQQAPPPPPPPTFTVHPATSAIRIDAVLDEPAWQHATVIPVNIEVQPGENVPAPVRTECLVTFDRRNLYVAFRAFDPEPKAIRAHLSDRDQAYRDDFVGIMIDPFNDRRRGFEFFVNPLGVQMDLSRNELSTDNQEDDTWDALWESAGRITPEGYVVEMAIPFSSLRFPVSQTSLTWGFSPFRAYPRSLRHQIFAVPLDRSNNCFMCQMPELTGLVGIEPGKNLELDPTVTAHRHDALRDEDDLASGFAKGGFASDAGLSARWGITPNVSLNAAINPDFSQVEADAAQLSVNERFALFFPEKRPFFLEGADLFSTPFTAVYTRTVTDPAWGMKVSGKAGPEAFSVWVARDRTRTLVFPSNQGSDLATFDESDTVTVGRYRRDIGQSSTIGALYTDRQGGDYHNRVAGFDGVLRLTQTDSVYLQALRSSTRYPEAVADEYAQPHGDFSANAYDLMYLHDSRDWSWWGGVRDVGRDFRADLGFMPRVDVRRRQIGGERHLYGPNDGWFTSISFGAEGERIEDHSGRLTDETMTLFAHYRGPLQSSANVHVESFKEYYAGTTYDGIRENVFFNVRPTGDFTCSIGISTGDAIDYDNSRPATLLRLEPGLTYNLGRHAYLQFDHTFERLGVAGGRLYQANLSQLKLIYQFNVRTFVRLIGQYFDLSRDPTLYVDRVTRGSRSVFGQALFSYKLNPRTVFFLGYTDNRAADGEIRLTMTDRTVFMKLGYAWLM